MNQSTGSSIIEFNKWKLNSEYAVTRAISTVSKGFIIEDGREFHAILTISCNDNNWFLNYYDGELDFDAMTESQTMIFKSNEIIPRPIGPSWFNFESEVYLDGEKLEFGPKYKEVKKTVLLPDGSSIERDERVLLSSSEVDIPTILIPALKSGKSLKLLNNASVGPMFDLNGFQLHISELETHCNSEDALK